MMHKSYKLHITTLTPLHIGTGVDLLKDYDYVTQRGRTWVIDEEALAETLLDSTEDALAQMVAGAPASDLLQPDDYQEDSPLFRYVMRGEPRATKRGSVIQEQIKDPWDQPYIPGSSLKGALRTALTYIMWAEERTNTQVDLQRMNYQSPASYLEQQLLHGDNAEHHRFKKRLSWPNHDIMRILQISDSEHGSTSDLQITNIQVAKKGIADGSPIEVESIAPGKTFIATLNFDQYLLEGHANQLVDSNVRNKIRSLGWQDDQREWLGANLIIAIQYWTVKRLMADKKRIRTERWQSKSLVNFYNDLHRQATQPNADEFLLQLGWGGGWDSKTMGDKLTENQDLFRSIAKKYNLVKKGQYRGGIFPKSRRVVISQTEHPIQTLGWVKIKMEAIP